MARPNPFLSGNWSPIDATSLTSREGLPSKCVAGAVPLNLSGSYLRVGPSPNIEKQAFDPEIYHLFAGDGLIVGIEFNNGVVTQRCRWIDAPSGSGIGNTAMVHHASTLLTLSEGSQPYAVDVPSLDTIGLHTFHGKLTHNVTAHPKVCPVTQELVFFGYEFGENNLMYTVANKEGVIEAQTNAVRIPLRKAVMAPSIHDIAITQKHSIVLDFPLWSMFEPIKPQDKSYFGVLPRHLTVDNFAAVKWFMDQGQFGYHVGNAFEDETDGTIKLIMCTSVEFDFRASNKTSMLLREWTLDMKDGGGHDGQDGMGTQSNPIPTKGRIICNIPCEFPTIDERLTGLPFNYIWANVLNQGKHAAPLSSKAILRHNVCSGNTTVLTLPQGMQGGEVRFVPRRNKDGTKGNEGVGHVVLLGHDSEMTSYVLIYDALFGPSSSPVAVVELSVRVPNGFHACWVDSEKYSVGSASGSTGTSDTTNCDVVRRSKL